jgi:hypothetical protein
MSFTWRFFGPDGAVLTGARAPAAPASHSQGDAESWLGEQWRELADNGVASASLYDGDDLLYGPMALTD